MDIVIIGGGASGLLSAVLINKKYPNYKVTLIDKNNKLAKKVHATGNGKCNFANVGNTTNKYNNDDFTTKLFNEISIKDLINLFDEFGIHSYIHNDLVYPISDSSETLITSLINKLTNTKIVLNSVVDDYKYENKQYIVYTNNGDFKADKIIIATGLGSCPKLGSSASFLSILKDHNYSINTLNPGLCPLKCLNNVKDLEGIRRKVTLSLLVNNKNVYQEKGEILFKKDGLSGICVFNASSIYTRLGKNKNSELHIDFLPEISEIKSLDGYFVKPLEQYLKSYVGNNLNKIHDVIFNITDTYDYDNSQVTLGGVAISNINDSFMSKIEDNVYLLGEILDIDGLCGGYNLMFAFISSMKLVKDL